MSRIANLRDVTKYAKKTEIFEEKTPERSLTRAEWNDFTGATMKHEHSTIGEVNGEEVQVVCHNKHSTSPNKKVGIREGRGRPALGLGQGRNNE